MKKFLLFLVLSGLTFAGVNAQVTLPAEQYFYSYTGVAADSVGSGTTSWTKAILLNKTDGLFYNIKYKLSDYTTGSAAADTVKLRGRYFENDTPTVISTVIWKGSGTDTTILFTQNANKVYYRYLDITVTRSAGKAKTAYLYMSLKK